MRRRKGWVMMAGLAAILSLYYSMTVSVYASELQDSEEAYTDSSSVNTLDMGVSETGLFDDIGQFIDEHDSDADDYGSQDDMSDTATRIDDYIPNEARAFLDAVNMLPESVETEEDAVSIESSLAIAMDCYDALLGTEYENRYDVVTAFGYLMRLSKQIDKILYGEIDTMAANAVWTQADLQAALNAGGTVKLPNDITVSANINTGQYLINSPNKYIKVAFWLRNVTVTLDLNGHTVTYDDSGDSASFENRMMYMMGSNLTITDSVGGGEFGAGVGKQIDVMESSSLILNGGTLRGRALRLGQADGAEPSSGYVIVNNGTLAMYTIWVNRTSKLSVTGGNIDTPIWSYNQGAVDINGGTLTKNLNVKNSSICNISGNCVLNGYNYFYDNSQGYISGGTASKGYHCNDSSYILFSDGISDCILLSDKANGVISSGSIRYVRLSGECSYQILADDIVESLLWVKPECLEINETPKFKNLKIYSPGTVVINYAVLSGIEINSGGVLTINDGVFCGESAGTSGIKSQIVARDNSKLIINGGKFEKPQGVCVQTIGSANVEINRGDIGEILLNNGSPKVVINGCKLGKIGVYNLSEDATEVVINGVVMSSTIQNYVLEKPYISIYGGKFSNDVSLAVADGYECNGFYPEYFVTSYGIMRRQQYAPGVISAGYWHSHYQSVPTYKNCVFAKLPVADDSPYWYYTGFIPETDISLFELSYDPYTGELLDDMVWQDDIVLDESISLDKQCYRSYDVNGDGVINIYDFGYLKNVISGADNFVQHVKDVRVRDNYFSCNVDKFGACDLDDLQIWIKGYLKNK